MKKAVSLLVCLLLSTSILTGCGSDDSSSVPVAPTPPPPEKVVKYDFNVLTGLDKNKDIPDGLRPAAVMIDNIKEALPQTGVSSADVVYEMVTEGGITRLMAVYSDYRNMPIVGPVRSGRDQFVRFAMPLNAIFTHIGGNIYANSLLNHYQYQDVNGYYLGTNAFRFDDTRGALIGDEHCWYTEGVLAQRGIDKVGTINTTGTLAPLFNFDKESLAPTTGTAKTVDFKFSNYADGSFVYNEETKTYLKSQFGAPHIDAATAAQLAFENVFVLYTDIGVKPDGYISDFDLTQGKGLYFSGGKYSEVSWEKEDDMEQVVIYDENKKELAVTPGKSYIAVVDNKLAETMTVDGAVVKVL